MKKILIVALTVIWLSALPVFNACNSQATTPMSEGFTIYLTRDNIPVSQMEALSHVEIADEPIISVNDVISYQWDTHTIELTQEAYKRIDELEVPTSGKSFVVCVDKAPIYWGAFWAGYSSQSFDGVTISVKPIFPVDAFEYAIQIRVGFPSSSFFQGEDPRANPVIMESLEKAGKLK